METGYLFLDKNILPTLLAISEAEQAKGLMYEPWKPPTMSFIYNKPKQLYFWMKNTPSPLDILFCKNGIVEQIHKGEPYSTASIGGNGYSDLVVELPFGTAKEMDIKIGCNVGLIKPNREELIKICASKYNIILKK